MLFNPSSLRVTRYAGGSKFPLQSHIFSLVIAHFSAGRWKTYFGLIAFLASETLIKQIPRLLGPGLSKGTPPSLPNGSITGLLANKTRQRTSRQIPRAHLAFGRFELQVDRGQVDDQVPVEEGAVHGRRGGQCRHGRGRAHWQHHVGHQLPGFTTEERLAERRQPDDQGYNVSASSVVLDGEQWLGPGPAEHGCLCLCGWVAWYWNFCYLMKAYHR